MIDDIKYYYNKDLEIQNRFLIPKDSNDKENDLNN